MHYCFHCQRQLGNSFRISEMNRILSRNVLIKVKRWKPLFTVSHWLKVASKDIGFRLYRQADQASSAGISETPGGLIQPMRLRYSKVNESPHASAAAGAAGNEMHQGHLLQCGLLHCSDSSMSLTTSTQPIHFQGGDWLQFLKVRCRQV